MMVLFFTHIPFVVNHTINVTLLERLQQHPLLFTTNHTDRTFFVWRLNSARPSHPGHSTIFCDRKSRAACAQSFAPWQQETIEIMLAISLTIAFSRYTYHGVILHAHPVRGESHNERNTTGEVATVAGNAARQWLAGDTGKTHILSCVKRSTSESVANRKNINPSAANLK